MPVKLGQPQPPAAAAYQIPTTQPHTEPVAPIQLPDNQLGHQPVITQQGSVTVTEDPFVPVNPGDIPTNFGKHQDSWARAEGKHNPVSPGLSAEISETLTAQATEADAQAGATGEWQPDPAQPQNSKRVTDQSRRFDTTQLKSTGHGYTVHRDYAAHFFRWGFAKRQIAAGDFVLDVGCGQEQPLARVLALGMANSIPARMVAVDYNKIKTPFNVAWLTTLDQFDFTSRWQETINALPDPANLLPGHGTFQRRFDVITCLEVIEHMHTCDGKRLLQAFRQVVKEGPTPGKLILSTPVFNGRAAANHIHEYTIPELQAFIEEAGFRVESRFGTFASYNDIKKVLNQQQRQDFERLREFYDGDVAACFYAPMFPDQSRNNVWICRPV